MTKRPILLVLFAHGSADPRWKRTFENIERDLKGTLGTDRVRLAYMEFTTPTLSDVAAEASRQGVTHLRLLPLFMSAGGHVARDIPEQVRSVESRFTDLTIEILPPIGEDPRMLKTIREIAEEAARA